MVDVIEPPQAASSPTQQTAIDEPVVFFDGVCSLCNASVDYAVSRTEGVKFAPLQGETAERLLSAEQRDLSSMVLRNADGTVLTHSTAALTLARDHFASGLHRVAARIALWIPRFFRDAVYRVIAANRYRLFGKRETCRLPNPDEAARFLP